MKSGSIERFELFSQFESLNEFNHHMEMWMLKYKRNFSKGELIGLKRLVRFAAKIPGVCNAKIGTMVKAIHEEYHDHGISRSTFKRMITKAKELGIFSVCETERKNGSQSSNLYVFNRFPESEPPKQEILNHTKETSNLLKTKKEIKKRNEERIELDYTFVSNRVPTRFVKFVKCFFPEAKVIEEYWHVVRMAAFQFDMHQEVDIMVDVAIDSFRQLIRKLKFTRVVKNPFAYFCGILKYKIFAYINHRENEKRNNDLIEVKPSPYVKNGKVMKYEWFCC